MQGHGAILGPSLAGVGQRHHRGHREGFTPFGRHFGGAVAGPERTGPDQLLAFDDFENTAGIAVAGVETVRTDHSDPEDSTWPKVELHFTYFVRPWREPALEQLRIGPRLPHQ